MKKMILLVLMAFLVAPFIFSAQAVSNPPSGLTGTVYKDYISGYPVVVHYNINFTWTKGVLTNYTALIMKQDSAPLNQFDGTEIYNGTAVGYNYETIACGHTYYFKAYGWNNTQKAWSSTNVSLEVEVECEDRYSGIVDDGTVIVIGLLITVFLFAYVLALYGMFKTGKLDSEMFIMITVGFGIVIAILGVIASML